jgi:ryanodine receptor 2
MNTTYTPHPIDTSDISLPVEMEELIEAMAENVHEVWAKNRIEQGWSYGAERNDSLKLHPCLVSYNKLSSDEKLYDRETAVETLKLIIKLGFNIVKGSST